jgi:hypothetical protein
VTASGADAKTVTAADLIVDGRHWDGLFGTVRSVAGGVIHRPRVGLAASVVPAKPFPREGPVHAGPDLSGGWIGSWRRSR